MKICYVLYPHSLKIVYILKHLEKRGFNIVGLNIYKNDFLFKTSKRILTYFISKQLTEKDLEEIEEIKYIKLQSARAIKNNDYLQNIEVIGADELSMKEDDILLCFDEKFLFETAVLNKKFMSPKDALVYSCKHMIYRKIGRDFFTIKSVKDFQKVPEGKYILKPSTLSCGKRSVFILNNKDDYNKIIATDPDIFSLNRIFVLEKYIEHVCEIWAMTLFDKDGNPYILWFSTEKNHSTFSVFEEDLYKNIKKLNEKLRIKNWMAYIQFLLDEKGNLHFVDLNPRLPGDDDWHELLYRYMTGKSFAKTIVELIIDHRSPDIIKTNRYVQEEEYNPKLPLQKNQRMWDYSDNYKEKPLLTFKKLDLQLNIR